MPFDPNSAKKAGEKSKRGPAKKEGPSIKEKMEMLYEKELDDLLVNFCTAWVIFFSNSTLPGELFKDFPEFPDYLKIE